jgi:acetyl-CoA carboxylase carboxyl transferase subunit alpha
VDRLLIMENAYYSVISPEGCAAILWKDRAKAVEAARALRLEPEKLIEWGIADEIVPEPTGGAHLDYGAAASALKKALVKNLSELKNWDGPEARYGRYRAIGAYGKGDSGESFARS